MSREEPDSTVAFASPTATEPAAGWFKNGSGWVKVLILVVGLAVGYAVRVERDTYRIDELEKWKAEHNAQVTKPTDDRLRTLEMGMAVATARDAAVQSSLAAINAELKDIRHILVRQNRKPEW